MDAVNLEGVWLMGKKIPVPAPLVPRRSQGGVGVYPWWRIDEICKNPIEQDADRILDENTVYSEDQKGLPPQVPSLEEWTLREELRRIRKHLGKVKGEIIHLRSRDKGARSEMRRKDEELESLRKKLDRLTRKILKLQRSKKQSILELPWMMPIAPTTVQPQAAAPPPPQPEVVKEEKDVVSVPAAEAPSRLDEFEYETRLAEMQSELKNAGTGGAAVKKLEKAVEKQELFVGELSDFKEKLERAASLFLEPDLDDGVVLSIAPLHDLVPWKEAGAYWDELLEGKYEWSSIGKQMREKGMVKE